MKITRPDRDSAIAVSIALQKEVRRLEIALEEAAERFETIFESVTPERVDAERIAQEAWFGMEHARDALEPGQGRGRASS